MLLHKAFYMYHSTVVHIYASIYCECRRDLSHCREAIYRTLCAAYTTLEE